MGGEGGEIGVGVLSSVGDVLALFAVEYQSGGKREKKGPQRARKREEGLFSQGRTIQTL